MAGKRKRGKPGKRAAGGPAGPAGTPAGETISQRLDAIYAELPKLDCKGKCWQCCGPVLIAPGERERVRREGGVDIPTVPEMRREHRKLCPALKSHRCTVYTSRPLVCRLWGIEETLRCPYGCMPEGGWMSELEASGFWLRVYAVAGWPVEKEEQLTPRQVHERLRRYEARVAQFPGGRPPRIQPDEPVKPQRSVRRWPWSR